MHRCNSSEVGDAGLERARVGLAGAPSRRVGPDDGRVRHAPRRPDHRRRGVFTLFAVGVDAKLQSDLNTILSGDVARAGRARFIDGARPADAREREHTRRGAASSEPALGPRARRRSGDPEPAPGAAAAAARARAARARARPDHGRHVLRPRLRTRHRPARPAPRRPPDGVHGGPRLAGPAVARAPGHLRDLLARRVAGRRPRRHAPAWSSRCSSPWSRPARSAGRRPGSPPSHAPSCSCSCRRRRGRRPSRSPSSRCSSGCSRATRGRRIAACSG